jgi:Transcriptional regulator
MDIKQLEYFVQVCQDGSFSKAAQNIYITQQALSKTISNLESELGLSLFYRSKKGISPTEFGEFLLRRSGELINNYRILNKEIVQYKLSSTGMVHLGVSIGMIAYITPNIIMEFLTQNPNIKIDMQEMSSTACENGLLDESLDIAIMLRSVEQDNSKFDSVLLKTHNMMAIINKNNPLAQQPYITIKDLKSQNLMANGERNKFNLETLCRANGFEPNIVGSSYQMIVLLSLVDTNDYISFCVDFNAHKHANLANIRLVPIKENVYKWEMCLVTRKDRHHTQVALKLREYIIDFLKE